MRSVCLGGLYGLLDGKMELFMNFSESDKARE